LVNLKFNIAFLDNQPEIYGTSKLMLMSGLGELACHQHAIPDSQGHASS